jgi:CHAT domain-containing protein
MMIDTGSFRRQLEHWQASVLHVACHSEFNLNAATGRAAASESLSLRLE